MKNRIIMVALSILATISSTGFAQTRTVHALSAMTSYGVAKSTPDTVTNTDTTYLYLQLGSAGTIKPLNEYNDAIYYWNIVPSITGTTTGKVDIQGSMTGTYSRSSAPISDWTTLTPSTSYSTADSVSYTSPSAGGAPWSGQFYRQFILTNNQYKYIRVRLITGGTQTSVMNGYVSLLPH